MADTVRGRDAAAQGVRRALVAVLEGDLETAERELAAVVRGDSRDPLAFLALAHLYRARGQIGRAIRIDQNLLLEPGQSRDLCRRARASLAADLHAGGYRDRAIAAYEEVLEHDGGDAEALDALIGLLADSGAHERALEVLHSASGFFRRPDPGREARLLLAKARTDHDRGQGEAARKTLRRALKRDASLAAAHALLGDIEAERGKPKAALAAWRAALEAGSDGATETEALWERIGSACQAQSKPEELERLARAHLEAHPHDGAARRALAGALAGRGQIEEAAAELRRHLEASPRDLATHAALGRLLLDDGREPEALKVLRELVEVLGGEAPAVAAQDREPEQRVAVASEGDS